MSAVLPSFACSGAERELARRCAARAVEVVKKHGGKRRPLLEFEMDLVACHANGCPLDFPRLLNADDFNFAHDVFGIERHLNRCTGKLGNCFLPRFHQRCQDADPGDPPALKLNAARKRAAYEDRKAARK
jgi:hypothetical protein